MEATTTQMIADLSAPQQSIQSESVFLINTSKDAQVISDLNLAFAGYGETYDAYVKPVSRQQAQFSLGIQTLIADGILKEISIEEAQQELRGRSAKIKGEQKDNNSNVSFEEDQMTEITPIDIQTQNAQDQDKSQLVPDLEG